MKTKHTPGPWIAKELLSMVTGERSWAIMREVISGGGKMLRRLDNKLGIFTEPDARLIAAAPDLLETIKAILTAAEIDADDGDLALEALTNIRPQLRAAIAKAEGREG